MTLSDVVVREIEKFDHRFPAHREIKRVCLLSQQEGYRMGLNRCIEYLSGSTFAEHERATVEGCIALLRSLKDKP